MKQDLGPKNPPRPEEKWRRIREEMAPFQERISHTLPFVTKIDLQIPHSAAMSLISIGFDMGQESRQTELDLLRTKAQKWDALEARIAKFYLDQDGNELSDEEGGNLCDIGEVAASAFGFL